MADQEKLFRKASLERLSSPEQLDQLMHVTTPKGWIALIALCALLTMALFWGIFGRVPTEVQGMGVLIRTGGVFDIEAPGGGVLTDLFIDTGSKVKKGDLIATIAQPELADEVSKAEKQLANLKEQQAQSKHFNEEDLKLKKTFYEKQQENQQFNISSNEQKIKWIQERLKNQEQLFDQGLITKQQLLQTKEEMMRAEDAIQNARNQVKQTHVTENELVQKYKEQALDYEVRVSVAEKNLSAVQNQLKINSEIFSPYTGTVLSVLYDSGSQVLKGSPIANLELVGEGVKELEAVVYVGPTQGKMIHKNMKVQVSPSNVKQEKYGFVIGQVRSISEFPETTQGMMRLLKNADLVKALAGGGAPYEVQVDLIENRNTYSGLKWSSGKGPRTKIYSGTLATCQIVTQEERPITLVIPALKKFFGL